MINVPSNYSQMDMYLGNITATCTIRTLNIAKFTKGLEQLTEVFDRFDDNPDTNDKPQTRLMAQFHGISEEVLISSQDFEKLQIEFDDSYCTEVINVLRKGFFLTHQEAWGLFLARKGLLD